MNRQSIVIPNLLVLFCALTLYHKSFLAGHLTRMGLLLIAASLLPLIYGLFQKLHSRIYITAASLINLVLFCLYSYIFAGTTHMLLKNTMASAPVYALILLIWILAVLTAAKIKYASPLFSIVLILSTALWFYFRTSMQWAANINGAMYGVIAAISALNIYCMLSSLKNKTPQLPA